MSLKQTKFYHHFVDILPKLIDQVYIDKLTFIERSLQNCTSQPLGQITTL